MLHSLCRLVVVPVVPLESKNLGKNMVTDQLNVVWSEPQTPVTWTAGQPAPAAVPVCQSSDSLAPHWPQAVPATSEL
jgi:hypothetical protein